MKRALVLLARGLAWLVGGVIALIVVAYLSLLAINWRDEPPSLNALRLEAIRRDRPPVADVDNGYVFAMKFADGVDENFRSKRSPGIQKIADECKARLASCMAAFEGGDVTLRGWIALEQSMLNRYRVLLRHTGWREADLVDVAAVIPAYGQITEGQKLMLAQAYLLAGEGDAAAVRKLLEEDVRFWRRTLTDSDILISKMISVAALNRTFELGNFVLRRLPAERQLDGMPAEWSIALTDEERSMLRSLTGEWEFGNRVIANALDSGSIKKALSSDGADAEATFRDRLIERLYRPMMKRQASCNLRADMFIWAAESMQLPLEQLPHGLERANAFFEDSVTMTGVLHWAYNPIGKIMALIGSSSFSNYGARVSDVEGTRRAVVLAVELRSRKVAAADVPAELGKVSLRAPYDNEPFTWDTRTQSIVFTGLQSGERARHAIRY